MEDNGNINCLSLKAYSDKGTCVDLKAKLRKAEIAFRNEEKKHRLVFEEVEEGGALQQCGIRNGDELITVNNVEVNNFYDVSHIVSVIRDCSPKVMLGMRRRSNRRRRVGSVPFVVLFELGITDSNPVHKFCGFYWNVSPQDIPFIPVTFKTIVTTYNFSHTRDNVEVIGMTGDKQNWLTVKNKILTFETTRSTFSLFKLYVYTPSKINPVPFDTPVIFVPQQEQSFAPDATKDDEITLSSFSSSYYRGKNIPGSGVFLKVFGVADYIYHIQSTQTDSYLEVGKLAGGEILVPVMSSNATTIRLLDSTTGKNIVLKDGCGGRATHPNNG